MTKRRFMVNHTQRTVTARRPRGNAAVELAVTLPLMALIVFGSVEVCSHIFTKQAIESAAYECVRLAISAGATDTQLQTKMDEILTARGITGATLTTTPSTIAGVERGERITVTISAPASSNSMALTSFVATGNIQAECVMVKEL